MATINLLQLWDQILAETKSKLPKPLWEITLHSGILPAGFDPEKSILTLYTMNEYVRNLLQQSFLHTAIEQAAEKALAKPVSLHLFISEGVSEPIVPSAGQMPSMTMMPQAAPVEENVPNFVSEQNITSQQETEAQVILKEAQTHDEIPVPEPLVSMPDEPFEPFAPLVDAGDFSMETPTAAQDDLFSSNYYDEPVIISKTSTKPAKNAYTSANDSNFNDNDVLDLETNNLNPLYTFENFVSGNTNRIAYAAALNVAQKLEENNYNPLFIYGDSGLGKTHLMHAIGNDILKRYPGKRVLCISSENFMNDLITAIQKKRNEYFREKYRSVDVLLVDDIQFLQGKDSTQMEFFHTFNTLQSTKKQIVLTSDVMPSNMKQMEKRLQTRFEGGYIVTIDTPDLETRIAILRSKANKEMAHPTKDTFENQGRVLTTQEMNLIINTIANNVQNNIRTLEGSFTKVINTACLLKSPITTSFVFDLIKDVIDITQKRQLDIEMIQECVTKYFKIKMEDLLSSSRKQHISYPRQVAMYLCRELLNTSYPSIAEAFAKKDHTTVIHAYEKISKELKKKEKTQRYVEELKIELSKICG